MREGHSSHTSPSSLTVSPKGKVKHSQQRSRLQGNAAAREGRKGERGDAMPLKTLVKVTGPLDTGT